MDPETIKSEERSWKRYKLLIRAFGIAVIGAIVIVSILRERIVNRPEDRITVYGQGQVEYVPDQATVTLGVQVSKAATSQEAADQLNQRMKGIIEAVKNAGADEKDIRTDSYSLSPDYDYQDGSRSVSGYDASQNLEIRLSDLKKKDSLASDVIQAALSQGANQVIGIDYDTSDLEDVKQEARIKAIEDAKAKAADLFKAAGLDGPGRIVGWHEETGAVPGLPNNDKSVSALNAGAGSVSAPALPVGAKKISVTMGVDYAAE